MFTIRLKTLPTFKVMISMTLKIADMIASISVIIHAQPLPVHRPQANTNHAIPRMICTGSVDEGDIKPLTRIEIPTITTKIVMIVIPSGRDFSNLFSYPEFVYIGYDIGFCTSKG